MQWMSSTHLCGMVRNDPGRMDLQIRIPTLRTSLRCTGGMHHGEQDRERRTPNQQKLYRQLCRLQEVL